MNTNRLRELYQEMVVDPCWRGFKDPLFLVTKEQEIQNELDNIDRYISYLLRYIRALEDEKKHN
jgi:hypothetical protein